MTNRFYPPSLAIELDTDYFEFNPKFIYAPALFNKPILRFYIHEVLHFWQTLSLGFITNLALQEWLQLLDHENKITFFKDQARKRLLNSFKEVHPKLGFSAYNLSEALCRFWDIHIMGPSNMLRIQHDKLGYNLSEVDLAFEQEKMTSEVFDMLMQIEDTYAGPYRLSLSKWGSKDSVILFPLIAYFCLQSPSPVEVFANCVDFLTDAIMLEKTEEDNIHNLWRTYFEIIRGVCNSSSIKTCNGVNLTSGRDVINRSALKYHPIYNNYLILLDLCISRWGPKIDLSFALPGDPDCRLRLGSTFRPPITIFYNGRWTGESGVTKTCEDIVEFKSSEELALISQEITQRYLKMYKVKRLANIT